MEPTLDWHLIERLAADRGVKAETLKKWRQRGIPSRWRLVFIEEAKSAGIMVCPSDFEELNRQGAV